MFPSRMITTMGGDKFRDEYSLEFDGTDEYLNLGDVSTFDGLEDMTISLWVYMTESRNQLFISKGGYNTSGASFYFNLSMPTDNGRMRFSAGNADAGTAGSGGFWYRNSMSDSSLANRAGLNKWDHIAVVYSKTDSNVRFYINGYGYTEGSGAGGSEFIAILNSNQDLRIANRGDEYFKGRISDVAIYNAAFTDSDIATIYNGREPYNHKEGSLSKNLKCWWRMGDGNLDKFGTSNGVISNALDETLGLDLVTNGAFAADSDWTKGAGWTIGSGVATCSANNNNLEQDISAVAATCYKITLDITSYTSGNLYVDIGGSSYVTFNAAGTGLTGYVVTANTNNLRLYGGSFRGSVDNIVVQKVGANAGIMVNMDSEAFKGDTP